MKEFIPGANPVTESLNLDVLENGVVVETVALADGTEHDVVHYADGSLTIDDVEILLGDKPSESNK